MAIITLKELVLLHQELFSSLGNYPTSELSIQQQQFQLLVRQKRMGLNIEPLPCISHPKCDRYRQKAYQV